METSKLIIESSFHRVHLGLRTGVGRVYQKGRRAEKGDELIDYLLLSGSSRAKERRGSRSCVTLFAQVVCAASTK